jgi:hypothetical protein
MAWVRHISAASSTYGDACNVRSRTIGGIDVRAGRAAPTTPPVTSRTGAPSRRLAARYLLLPLPSDLAGGGTIDLSRIRFADPGAFGHRHGRTSSTLAVKVDHGFRRLLGL